MADKTLPTNEQEKKAEAHRRQLAGLKPIQKGEVRNPSGINGHRRRQELVAAILDEPDNESDAIEPGSKRIRNVVLAMARAAKAGDGGAGKTLVEQYAGKAKQQVELSGELTTNCVAAIPMPCSREEWESTAALAQDQLKDEVKK